ncbi:MAG: PAS domain-containing sensor histidine kinase [Pseudomonadota bacterium]
MDDFESMHRPITTTSDGLLRNIIDQSRDAILVVDSAHLLLLDVNDVACKMLGYLRQDLVGSALASVECSLLDVFFWSDLALDPIFEIDRVAETEWMRQDGVAFHVEKRVASYTENGKNYWIIYAEDLTRRRQIEQQQVHLVSQLQSSLESTAEGILAVDLHGQVVYLNRRFALMWAIPDEVLVGRHESDTLSHITSCLLDANDFSQSLQRMKLEPHLETEDTLALIDGRYVICVSKPEFLRDSLVGRVFSVRDITAMKVIETDLLAARDDAERASQDKSRMLDALRVSESRLRRLVNSSLIGFMQGNQDGNLTDVNETLLQLLGVHRKQFTSSGLNWMKLTPVSSHSTYNKAMRELQASGQAIPFEAEVIRNDETRLPVMVGLARLEGSSVEWVGFVLDLTEQRKADRVKSDFISMVSHELRTPLTSIRGALGLLENGVGGELTPKLMSLIKIAHKNSQRLGTLVNDLLDMEKLASGKMNISIERFDLVAIARQAIEANASYAQALKVQYRLGAHPDQAWVMGDADRVMQVFANLLSNAAKFAPSGDFVEIRLIEQEGALKVEIEDHGSGIPLAFRDKIFRKFAQADDGNTRQQGGTGLGLNITKTFIEKMGGEIGFESEEGIGTVFWFTLLAGVRRRDDGAR